MPKRITDTDIQTAEQVGDRLIKNELFQHPSKEDEKLLLEQTAKYAQIDGYWKDDETGFTSYLVKLDEAVGDDDENVFYYFKDLATLKDAVEKAHATALEFVVTDYELLP